MVEKSRKIIEKDDQKEKKQKNEDKLQKSSTDDNKLISDLEELIKTCLQKNQIIAALLNCQKLISIYDQKQEISNKIKYQKLWDKLYSEQHGNNQKLKKEQLEIQNKINQLQNIIKIEKDTAPELEELTITDMHVDVDDLTMLSTQLDTILENNRVKTPQSIDNHTLYRTSSGKSYEMKQTLPVKIQPIFASNDNNKSNNESLDSSLEGLDWIVENTIVNSEKDPIEEAFFDDLIPYNYEISEILVNDQPLEHSEYYLAKKGLEVQIPLKDLKEKGDIHLKYRLHPRISRTTLVSLPSKLFVIHSYSNIKSQIDLAENENIKTELFFTNQYNPNLQLVTIEDIIPLFYQYNVEEKKSTEFPSSKEVFQTLVKWKLFNIPLKEGNKHEYDLFEIHHQEDLKKQAEVVLSTSLSNLNTKSPYKSEEITNQMQDLLERLNVQNKK